MRPIQSLERAFVILRALAVSPMRVTELAGHVGLPKTTVVRMLHTLEELGAVARDASGEYRIGPGLGQLAPRMDLTSSLVVAATPHLARLSAAVGEAAMFSVPAGWSMHYLLQIDAPHAIQVRDYSGTSCPMHVAPAGFCQLANWPEAERERYLARPLEAYTTHTLTDPAEIRKRLDRIRLDGYCWAYDEFADGLTSVAAPVLDVEGRMIGALTVHGPSYRFPGRQDQAAIGRVVREAAERFGPARRRQQSA